MVIESLSPIKNKNKCTQAIERCGDKRKRTNTLQDGGGRCVFPLAMVERRASDSPHFQDVRETKPNEYVQYPTSKHTLKQTDGNTSAILHHQPGLETPMSKDKSWSC
jgi:hypothetical protein